jgi:hypothetical protein
MARFEPKFQSKNRGPCPHFVANIVCIDVRGLILAIAARYLQCFDAIYSANR